MNKLKAVLCHIKERFFPDGKFRKARIWSNLELKKIARLFNGDVINVSGWKDSDKRGGFYTNYFVNANSYTVSNYYGPSGLQGGIKDETFIDLEEDLNEKYYEKYDVVFNHTTLEHVYDFQKAFKNLCLMTRDVLIIVLPFMQQLHPAKNDYDDYWRFTPHAVKKMMEDNSMSLLYLSANNKKSESIYLFAVGSKQPQRWAKQIGGIDNSLFENLGEKII